MRRGPQRRPKESFAGPRLVVRVAPKLRAQSAFTLAIAVLTMAGLLVAAVTVIALGISALVHSVGSNP